MKLVLLVTGGRGGSDFFQGLLDGHNEILQFPGVLRANNDLFQILELDNYNEVANKFGFSGKKGGTKNINKFKRIKHKTLKFKNHKLKTLKFKNHKLKTRKLETRKLEKGKSARKNKRK